MMYQIQGNPKSESHLRTAFLEQIRGYDPGFIGLIVGPDDLIDPEGPAALSNLPLNPYHLKLVNVVRYVDGTQLYPIPGTGTIPEYPVVNTVGETPNVEAGKTD